MPPNQPLISLNQFPTLRLAKVRCILGNSSFVSRLASNGIFVGLPILLHERRSNGRVIASVLDQRFDLPEADCARILVEPFVEPQRHSIRLEVEDTNGRIDE